MSNDLVKRRMDGEVCFLTLNRPDVLNALDTHLMRELVKALTAVAYDDHVRCVVLTGAGKGFCAGGDVRAIGQAAKERVSEVGPGQRPLASLERRVQWVRRSAEASRLLHEMPKPTIAMINGACAGAGLSLAAACDFRHAGRRAVFRAAFTPGGVSGDYGGSWLWTHILGTAKARQLFLIDAKRNAKEALEFGLVDAVHDDDSLEAEVTELAQKLAGLPGKAAAYAKANLNAAMTEKFSDSLDRESLAMMLSREVMVREAKARKAEQAAEEEVKRTGTAHGSI
ncbi:enoyl-CoA hydratase/isomerase family protein [Novosphingobium pentaromativorans]|uniref:Enoyl-CoA hydratase n=1 Tax=Novosphingobium pentaromativorans US6-1 TaxID=1088721 RepID=G6ECJ1_9SPHN|nr:enoyl-CoA hydratase-related protein [Novosphingobium pentaromativorans]EHJ60902.1 hypothetical protein NSU_2062 [Novosphingobium pentaromativorans US6-1]